MRSNLNISILIAILLSCNSRNDIKSNYSAAQLYASAKSHLASNSNLESTYNLLYQTLQVDSNYFQAYESAYLLQGVIQKPNINIGMYCLKQMIRLKPDSPDLHLKLGIAYLSKGDTISAKKCFSTTDSIFNKKIAPLKYPNHNLEAMLANKGYNLILLGHIEEGKELWKNLYNNSLDSSLKDMLLSYIAKSADEIKTSAKWE